MKNFLDNDGGTEPMNGDERWIDALLREHARAGSGPDAGFLARVDAATGSSDPGPGVLEVLESPTRRKRARFAWHPAWWAGAVAACAAIMAGIVWKARSAKQIDPGMQAESAAGHGGFALVTTLPGELIEGTPKPMNVPRLVQVPETAPTMMVPEGTVLLSRGKQVTSSDSNPIIGDLGLITDGDKDAGEGYFVELLEGLQWVQIDLGESAAIQAVWLWHFHSQRRAYHDVILRISDDPEFKREVATIYNNDYDDSAGMGKGDHRPYVESRFGLLVDAKGTRGRYLRLYSNGNTSNELNHYIEVEVFGVPDKK